MLIGVDATLRCKVARPLRMKEATKGAILLEAVYKKGGAFKYSKVFQCQNGSKFKSDVKKLL